ncbi:hypothetical protein SAURM35S_03509 [Streptomyces aurantiogriseus]
MNEDPPAPDDPPAATLRSLLAFEDGNALRLLCAPAAADAVVRRIAVGLDDLTPRQEGTLLLAVGAAAEAGTVREAARRGACAVVLGDADAAGTELVAAARETGVALLVRAEGTGWAEAAALLRSALSYLSVGDSDAADALRGPEAIPSLAALAARVAAYVKGSITIEDTQLRVLAHSATGPDADPVRRAVILGGRVPDWRVAELRRSGLLRALWTSRDVLHRPADGDTPERLIVAVRSGQEVLGSIWAAADGTALAPDAARHLRTAAAPGRPAAGAGSGCAARAVTAAPARRLAAAGACCMRPGRRRAPLLRRGRRGARAPAARTRRGRPGRAARHGRLLLLGALGVQQPAPAGCVRVSAAGRPGHVRHGPPGADGAGDLHGERTGTGGRPAERFHSSFTALTAFPRISGAIRSTRFLSA